LEKHLAAQPADVAHISRADEGLVLAAPTPDLQRFVIRHADNKEAFGGLSNLQKKR
jgi:hypothetical protein